MMLLLLNLWMIVSCNFFASVDGSLNLYIDKYESEKFTESSHPITYVENGVVNNYSIKFHMNMYPKNPELHFIWQRLTDMPISYAIALEFMDSMDAIGTPLINISRTGNVPRKEQVFRVDVPCNGKRKDQLTFYLLINFTFHADNKFLPLKLPRVRLCDKGLNHTIPSEGMSFLAERPKLYSDDYSHFIFMAIVSIIVISFLLTISMCKCIIREPESKLIYQSTGSRRSSTYDHCLSPRLAGHVNEVASSFRCESSSRDYYSIAPSYATSRCSIPKIDPENLLNETVHFKGDFGYISAAILHADRDKMKVCVKYFCNEKSSEEISFLYDQATELHYHEHTNIHKIAAYHLDKYKLYLVYTDVDNLMMDLKSWLQNHPSFPHIYRQTLSIAHICAGMEYLHRHGIVHADIAARNCIVCSPPKDPNEFVVKISDSTLARVRYPKDYECCDDNQYLPIKWMAYEWLLKAGEKGSDYVPNESSDIWALGVTIWEIINFGQDPYVDGPISRVDMISRLKRGLFLSLPTNTCLDNMYDLIKLCWSLRPEQRPKASFLSSQSRKKMDSLNSYV